MEIDYVKISKEVNEFGKYILISIQNEDYKFLTKEQLDNINNLLNMETFIVVNEPDEIDMIYFNNDNGIYEQEFFNNKYIPAAHGGRVKKDNKIHIYPYTKHFEMCKNNDEIIKKCIDNLIVHEIFHYFIRPNISVEVDECEEDFQSFLTEGLVQKKAEEFSKSHRLNNPKSNYGINVDFANRLLNSIKVSEKEKNRIIFQSNYMELLNASLIGNELYNEYVTDWKFKKEIDELVKEISQKVGYNVNKTKDTANHFKKLDKEQCIAELKIQINNIYKYPKQKQKIIAKLDSLSIYNGNSSEMDEKKR